jgi:hypothetical protein
MLPIDEQSLKTTRAAMLVADPVCLAQLVQQPEVLAAVQRAQKAVCDLLTPGTPCGTSAMLALAALACVAKHTDNDQPADLQALVVEELRKIARRADEVHDDAILIAEKIARHCEQPAQARTTKH